MENDKKSTVEKLENAGRLANRKILEGRKEIARLLRKKEETDDKDSKDSLQDAANRRYQELRGAEDIANTTRFIRRAALGCLAFWVLKSIFGGNSTNNYYSYPPMMHGSYMGHYGDGNPEHYHGSYDIDAINREAAELGITQDGELLIDQGMQQDLTEIARAPEMDAPELSAMCREMHIEPQELVQEYGLEREQSLSMEHRAAEC